jgi:hypothetical protein
MRGILSYEHGIVRAGTSDPGIPAPIPSCTPISVSTDQQCSFRDMGHLATQRIAAAEMENRFSPFCEDLNCEVV